MDCPNCVLPRLDLSRLAARLREGANLMVGQPDYETYLAHRAKFHPDEIPMNPTEFFRNRENRRFGGGVETGGFRCC